MDTTHVPADPSSDPGDDPTDDPLAGLLSGPARRRDHDGPTFSVIIPTFRRPALLGEAVASVLAQTRQDWECLIVDDGGDEVVEPPDPRVRVLRRPWSGGPAAARNTGVEAARGRYLTFLDDDDRYTPRRLELAAAGLARAPVAVCWTRWFDPAGADAGRPAGDPSGGPARGRWLVGDVSDQILDTTTPHLGATAVAAEAIVPFDPRYRAAEDVEWWLRQAERARVDTIAELGCEIRRHDGVRANQTDVRARLVASQRLLDERTSWFANHPRAKSYRWARMGAMAAAAGDRPRARNAYLRSVYARPTPGGTRGLIQAWLPHPR